MEVAALVHHCEVESRVVLLIHLKVKNFPFDLYYFMTMLAQLNFSEVKEFVESESGRAYQDSNVISLIFSIDFVTHFAVSKDLPNSVSEPVM